MILNEDHIKELENFLENTKMNIILIITITILLLMKLKRIKFLKFLKNLKFNGGEGGFEPTNELPRCWFSRPVLSTAQPPLLEINFRLLITIKATKITITIS